MNKLVLTALVITAAACQPDTKNLERKIDDLTKNQAKMMDMLARGGGGAGAAAQQQRPQRVEPDRAKMYAVPIDGDPGEGPDTAKVTMVKAYDYACPYCEKVRDTMDELRKKYGNDLRFVYKQMVVHPKQATASALAYCAANKQGKAKEMDRSLWDKGFKNRQMDASEVPAVAEANGQPPAAGQKCWETANGCPIVVGFAQEIGLNIDKFKSDMKGECQQMLQKDQRELQALGVSATPSFFINGRFLSGAMPIENFSALIDEELKKANERIQSGKADANNFYASVVLKEGLKQLDKPTQ